MVGEFGDVVKSEHPGNSLQGMGTTKDTVQQIGVDFASVDTLSQSHEIKIEFFNDLLGFPEKILEGPR
jgi:hypothetical protein